MKRLILIALVCLLIFRSDRAHTYHGAVRGTAAFPLLDAGSALRRGINLGNMLEAPTEGDWGLRVRPEYLSLAKQAGFDFVRLPIRWNAHAGGSEPYTIDPAFFVRIDQIIGWALENHLAIILDFHNYGEIMTNPSANQQRFLGIWRQIAEHYRDLPPQVMFELLNEPNDWLNAATWNDYAREALAVIRLSNPSRVVIIDTPASGYYAWVNTLEVPNDLHVMVTFHYYEPFRFTHQGADWLGVDTSGWLGTTWQGTDAEKTAVEHEFDQVAAWAQRLHARIFLGEFGAYSRADLASRIRWTSFIARVAEQHGFPWAAYWEFAAGFGIYDPEAGMWRLGLLQALIPDTLVVATP
jgi:endoglucanase